MFSMSHNHVIISYYYYKLVNFTPSGGENCLRLFVYVRCTMKDDEYYNDVLYK